MKFRRLELGDEAHQEQPDEQQRTDCISDIQGLSEKVTPGLTERVGSDFHDPEERGDLRKPRQPYPFFERVCRAARVGGTLPCRGQGREAMSSHT